MCLSKEFWILIQCQRKLGNPLVHFRITPVQKHELWVDSLLSHVDQELYGAVLDHSILFEELLPLNPTNIKDFLNKKMDSLHAHYMTPFIKE